MLFTQQLQLRYLCFRVRVSEGNDWFDLGRRTLIIMFRKDEISCYLKVALESDDTLFGNLCQSFLGLYFYIRLS